MDCFITELSLLSFQKYLSAMKDRITQVFNQAPPQPQTSIAHLFWLLNLSQSFTFASMWKTESSVNPTDEEMSTFLPCKCIGKLQSSNIFHVDWEETCCVTFPRVIWTCLFPSELAPRHFHLSHIRKPVSLLCLLISVWVAHCFSEACICNTKVPIPERMEILKSDVSWGPSW